MHFLEFLGYPKSKFTTNPSNLLTLGGHPGHGPRDPHGPRGPHGPHGPHGLHGPHRHFGR